MPKTKFVPSEANSTLVKGNSEKMANTLSPFLIITNRFVNEFPYPLIHNFQIKFVWINYSCVKLFNYLKSYIIILYTFVLVLYAEKTKKKVFVQKLWELARIVDVLMNVLLMPIVLERKNVVSMIAVESLAYQVCIY